MGWKKFGFPATRAAFVAASVLLVASLPAEIYYPDPALTVSPGLQVVETGQLAEFNANPSGGTAVTEGQVNLALAANGGVGFESSRISDTYGDDKLTNGVYGLEIPDNDDPTRPWIAQDSDEGGFAGVKLGAPSTVRAIGFGSRFPSRSDGTFTLQVTTADFAGVDLEDRAQVEALGWTTVGTLVSTTAGEFGRHLVAFAPVAGVTAVRIVVSEMAGQGTAISEIEAYSSIEGSTEPEPPAPPTDYTLAVLADNPIHYYRFEETHTDQPAKDAVASGGHPGAFRGNLTPGMGSALPRLGKALYFDGSDGTLVDLGPPFHVGPSATVEAWVNLDAAAEEEFSSIAARWEGSYELDIDAGTGFVNFVTKNSAGTEFALARGAVPFTRGEWHHVVGVFEGGRTTVFVDGAPGDTVDLSALGSDLQDVGETLFIGSTRNGNGYNWKGLIDEVAFYDRALSPLEIANHFLASQGCSEQHDSISIIGPVVGDVGVPIQLTAKFEGIDPGVTATYLWEIVVGEATLSSADGPVVTVIGEELGAFTIRVTADDGLCEGPVTAWHTVSISDPRADLTAYTEAVLADGPIHYYRLEETQASSPAKDAVGQFPSGDHPGAFSGNVAVGRPSAYTKLGRAAYFDATASTFVDLGPPFHPGATVCVEAWANLDPDAGVSYYPIAARWDGSYELDYNGGTGLANFVTKNSGGEFALAQSSQPFTPGVWHHVVGIFDRGKTTIYVDGIQGTVIDTSASGTELQGTGDALYIGSTRDGTQYRWKGSIDEVAFYDHPLSPERIAAHILAAKPYFHRGDANGDGGFDLSDSIFVLGHLFLGGAAPGCRESANADDNGDLDLTDAIYILNTLFLGGRPIPPPGPPPAACGIDPTESPGMNCSVYDPCG